MTAPLNDYIAAHRRLLRKILALADDLDVEAVVGYFDAGLKPGAGLPDELRAALRVRDMRAQTRLLHVDPLPQGEVPA